MGEGDILKTVRGNSFPPKMKSDARYDKVLEAALKVKSSIISFHRRRIFPCISRLTNGEEDAGDKHITQPTHPPYVAVHRGCSLHRTHNALGPGLGLALLFLLLAA